MVGAAELRSELLVSELGVRQAMLDQIAILQGFESYRAMFLESTDSELEMQQLCEAERLALAELERLEDCVARCVQANA